MRTWPKGRPGRLITAADPAPSSLCPQELPGGLRPRGRLCWRDRQHVGHDDDSRPERGGRSSGEGCGLRIYSLASRAGVLQTRRRTDGARPQTAVGQRSGRVVHRRRSDRCHRPRPRALALSTSVPCASAPGHAPPGTPTPWVRPSTSPREEDSCRPEATALLEICPGDVIVAPDGEEHWHGASPDHFMTHLSMTGGDAQWGTHVTDTEYSGDRR